MFSRVVHDPRSMEKLPRQYALKGLKRGGLMLLIAWIGLLSVMVYQFEGECGGLMPFLSGPKECSVIEFLMTDGFFITVIALFFHSPWIILFLSITTLTGYGIGRIKNAKKDRLHQK